jgi:hypothetical protein
VRRAKRIALAVGVVAACGTGVAFAAHTQVDPATVPTGFLTAHSAINNVPASVVADALKSGRTDVFIEHGRLDAQKATGFRTSPGPDFVIVQKGSLSFRDAAGGQCRSKGLVQNQGVMVRTQRVHELRAGAAGADYYAVYLLPRRTGPHFAPASTPAGC